MQLLFSRHSQLKALLLIVVSSFLVTCQAISRQCLGKAFNADLVFCDHISYNISIAAGDSLSELDNLARSTYLAGKGSFEQDCCLAVYKLDICAQFLPRCSSAEDPSPLRACPLFTCSATFSYVDAFTSSYTCDMSEPGQCSNSTEAMVDIPCSCQDGSEKNNRECLPYSADCYTGRLCEASTGTPSCSCAAKSSCPYGRSLLQSSAPISYHFCAVPPSDFVPPGTSSCTEGNGAAGKVSHWTNFSLAFAVVLLALFS